LSRIFWSAAFVRYCDAIESALFRRFATCSRPPLNRTVTVQFVSVWVHSFGASVVRQSQRKVQSVIRDFYSDQVFKTLLVPLANGATTWVSQWRRHEGLSEKNEYIFEPDFSPRVRQPRNRRPESKTTTLSQIPGCATVVSYEFLWKMFIFFKVHTIPEIMCDYIYLNAYYCILFSSRVRVRISFSVQIG